jgi:hypothetical protein
MMAPCLAACGRALERCFETGVLCCMLLLSLARSALAEESVIWDEQPVAAATIGLDGEGKPISRRFHVVAIGPELPAADQAMVRECSRKAVAETARKLHESLRALSSTLSGAPVDGPGAPMSPASVKLDTDTDLEIDKASSLFDTGTASCVRDKTKASAIKLAIVQRQCDEHTAQCGDRPLIFADAPEALAFSVLNRWADIRNEGPTLPANVVLLLPNVAEASTKADKLISSSSESLRGLDPSVRWPDVKAQPDPQALAQAQARLEALVLRARKDGKKLERNAARLTDVPMEIAVRVVDVLDEPQEAVLDLRKVADAKLSTIDDELARTRIAECARYRGLPGAVEVASCAGYRLEDHEMLNCLAGGRCVPALSDMAYASILEMVKVPSSLKDLGQAGDLPRVSAFLGRSLEDALAPLGSCAKQRDRKAAAECLLEDQLGKDGKRLLECFRNEKDKLSCALGKALPAEAQLALTCLHRFKDPRDQAVCVAGDKLPREMVELMRCKDASGNDPERLARCMAGKLAGGDTAKALGCVQKHGADYAEAAMCFAGPELPREAALAVQCAQGASDATGAAVCYGTKALPTSLRKPVQCLAESGGDPLGTGVCMAADSLSPEQRIVLQCLVSTGGEPIAMATCTGGQLAMKEFFQCVDKRLFDGNCVGKNNAFRKLVENVTGQQLSSKTLVGQYLNLHLDVVKTQIAFAQAALKGADRLGQDVARESKRAAENIGKEIKEAPVEVVRQAERLGKDTMKEGTKLVKKLTPKIRIRVKKPKWK